jgi:hypothetical protein
MQRRTLRALIVVKGEAQAEVWSFKLDWQGRKRIASSDATEAWTIQRDVPGALDHPQSGYAAILEDE